MLGFGGRLTSEISQVILSGAAVLLQAPKQRQKGRFVTLEEVGLVVMLERMLDITNIIRYTCIYIYIYIYIYVYTCLFVYRSSFPF